MAVVPLTCNLDIIDDDHFIQLQQELFGEAGQAGYEQPATLPGTFLGETRGAQLVAEHLPPTAGCTRIWGARG